MDEINEFKYQTIWQYLDELGVLEVGTPKEIAEAKKEYWNLYRQHKKKKSRKQRPELNISFEDMEEKKRFKDLAKEHEMHLSIFIREAALGYVHQKFVQPNETKWSKILQELGMIRLGIQQIADEAENEGFYKNYSRLLEKHMELEEAITGVFNKPPLLEMSIEETLRKEPWRKDKLLKIIQSI